MAFKGKLFDVQKKDALKIINRYTTILRRPTGTGKTITSIAVIEKLFEINAIDRALIFALASLKEQWLDKIKKYTDRKHIRLCVISGGKDNREKLFEKCTDEKVIYIILNYEQARYCSEEVQNLIHNPERTIIFYDEISKKCRNYKAKVTESVQLLKAKWKCGISATPVDKRPDDLFSLFNIIRPGFLGDWWSFDKTYIKRNFFGGVAKYINLDILHKKIKKYFVGGDKDDEELRKCMPKVIFKDYRVDLSSDCRRLYKYVINDILNDIKLKREEREMAELLRTNTNDDEVDGTVNTGAVKMQKLTFLRQLMNDPRLVVKSETMYSRELRNKGILNQISIKNEKLDLLKEEVSDFLQYPENKVIVFSYFKKMLQIMKEEFAKMKIHAELYTGDTSNKEKTRLQNAFNDGNLRVLLASDAGGCGLDLPGGNMVINYDIPQLPSALLQRNRTQRIGSKHKTNIISSIMFRDSYEERLINTLNRERELASIVTDGGGESEYQISTQSFKEFLQVSR